MIKYTIYNSIRDIKKEEWEQEIKNRYFLSYNYLLTLEKTCEDQKFKYVIVTDQENLVAVFYFQLLKIKGKDLYDYVPQSSWLVKKLFEKSLSWIDAELLVLGNVIFTCEHGVMLKDYDYGSCCEMAIKAINTVNASLSNKMRGIMISENIFPESYSFFKSNGYHDFRSEDRMEMDISAFLDFQDYKSRLISKYRTRLKKIYKLNNKTEVININSDNYHLYGDEIVSLFKNVINKSKFNIAKLSDQYFKELLDNQTRFKIRGFLIDGKLVSFVSFFELKEIVEVHYVGIDYEVNKKSKVYNYMLYNILDYSILNKKPKICFSRTSQELKSTLGAYPVQVNSLLKINNRLYNFIVSFFLARLKPKVWKERRPFKS